MSAVARSFSLIQGQLRQTHEPPTGVRRRSPDVMAAAQRMLAEDAGIAKAIRDGSVLYEVDMACEASAHEHCGGWHFDGQYHVCTCACHPGALHVDHGGIELDVEGDCA